MGPGSAVKKTNYFYDEVQRLSFTIVLTHPRALPQKGTIPPVFCQCYIFHVYKYRLF